MGDGRHRDGVGGGDGTGHSGAEGDGLPAPVGKARLWATKPFSVAKIGCSLARL